MIRVLLAEDQALVRHGLKMMIESDPDMRVTGEAGDGGEAVALCERQRFNVAVLDIRMPMMDGLKAARIILERQPECKVIILTTFNDDEYALEALKIGASGYMLKDAEPEALVRAIRSCLVGGMPLGDQVTARVIPRLLEQPEPEPADPSLTPREMAIIRKIGEGLNNKEIAAELSLSVGTVKNHVSQILDKLELRDRTQLAIYAIRHGLV